MNNTLVFVVIICFLLILFLYLSIIKQRKLKNGKSIESKYNNQLPIEKNHDLTKHLIEEGKYIAKNSDILIVLFCCNCSRNIERIQQEIYGILKKFNNYQILIFEYNSLDNTRSKIREWKEEDSNVDVMGGMNYNFRECDEKEFTRKLCQSHIDKHYKDFDYMLEYNCDVKSRVYLDGIYHSLAYMEEYDKIERMSSNNLRYSEYFGWVNYKIDHLLLENESYNVSWYNRLLGRKIFLLFQRGEHCKKIENNFNICDLYKGTSLFNKKYYLNPSFICVVID